jgi:AraC family transcriptional regulator, alkane utilization regulator
MHKKPENQTVRPDIGDPLCDILASTLLESGILANFFFTAPWAVDCGHLDEGAPFHAVVDGSCGVKIPGQECLILRRGDVVLLPRWQRHTLCSSAEVPAQSIEAVFRLNGLSDSAPVAPPKGPLKIVYGGGQQPTHILSGIFYFRNQARHPILNRLPECVHFKSSDENFSPWLDTALRVLGKEAVLPRPGYAMMVRSLADLLLVEMLRSYLLGQHEGAVGWLSALMDPTIGHALRCMHADPGAPWTLRRLAQVSGRPRSSFAAEFRRLVGEAPLRYLTGWRMHLAAERLAKRETSIAVLAEQLGYGSEISFSKAFKRHIGEAPGRFRERGKVKAR